jgi:streptogramin lyase
VLENRWYFWPSIRLLRVVVAALAFCCFGGLGRAASAGAVAIVQLPLPAASGPARVVFSAPGGAIIGGSTTSEYEHVTVSPFAVTSGPTGYEVIAGTQTPGGTTWFLGWSKHLVALYEVAASGPVARFVYPKTTNNTREEGGAESEVPTGIVAGTDGALWIADTQNDTVERYLPGVGMKGSFSIDAPSNLATGPNGSVWFSDLTGGSAGLLTPEGQASSFVLAGGNLFEPPSGPFGIAAGPEGAVWITEQSSGRIARLTLTELHEYAIPLPAGLSSGMSWRAEPRYIVAGSEGDMWFTDPGTESVGRVTPTGEITEYRVPPVPKSDYRAGSEGFLVPDEIAVVPGGLLFTETDAKALGLIEPNAPTPPETIPTKPTPARGHISRNRSARCRSGRRAGGASRRRSDACRSSRRPKHKRDLAK